MTKKHPELPPRVHPKGRWYYHVTYDSETQRHLWKKLTPTQDGIPALYRKLADLAASDIAPDRIPALIVDWHDEVGKGHGKKQQENDRWVMGVISEAFAEFRARDVSTPACLAFLKPYRAKPRTHNLMRTGLLELMRYAEGKESDGTPFRDPGTNPVASIKRMPTPARTKYITDSELRRIKVAAMWGNDGLRTPSGPIVCAVIDMAYLTGQRISDLLDMRWNKRAATNAKGEVTAPYICDEGVYFQPDKTVATTGAKVLITWTPRLRELVERIKGIGPANVRWVFTKQDHTPYLYSGFTTAWGRAVKRAKVKDCHFHDIRAKAITDTDETMGRQAARRKGAHSTEQQTADYIRNRKAQKTEATR
jgi:integrase